VQLATAAPLDYDCLVMALGGRTSYFGHPEWEQHAPGLKSIEDAIRIRREVRGALERAEMTEDLAERRRGAESGGPMKLFDGPPSPRLRRAVFFPNRKENWRRGRD
jgi:hypothetical protein